MRFFRRKQPIGSPEGAPPAAARAPANPSASASETPSAATTPAGGPVQDRPTGGGEVVVAAPLEERVDGLRAWLGQVDRRLGIRTYALGAAVVLALAAGIVGVVLAVSAKDESATKEELRTLRNEVQGVGEEAAAAAEDDVASLSSRLEDLSARVSTLATGGRTVEGELSVVKDDIDDLRTQISDLEASAAASNDSGSGDETDNP